MKKNNVGTQTSDDSHGQEKQLKRPANAKCGIFAVSILEHRERVANATPTLKAESDINLLELIVPIQNNVKIPATLYTPNEKQDSYPTLFYIPGTAFIANESKFTHVICSHICAKAKCQVIVINHRLAPENQFPSGYKDTYKVFKFFIENFAHHYRIDTNRIAVSGYSSGGNFAALITIQAKQEGIAIARQILISPMVDLSRSLIGFENYENKDTDISEAFVNWFLQMYIPHNVDPKDPSMSPFWQDEKNIKGMPPTDIILAENDRFRADSEYYYMKLIHAGVLSNRFIALGQKHSFLWHKLPVIDKFSERVMLAFKPETLHHLTPKHTLCHVKEPFSADEKEDENTAPRAKL